MNNKVKFSTKILFLLFCGVVSYSFGFAVAISFKWAFKEDLFDFLIGVLLVNGTYLYFYWKYLMNLYWKWAIKINE